MWLRLLCKEVRCLEAENQRLRESNVRLMEENGKLRFEAKSGTSETGE